MSEESKVENDVEAQTGPWPNIESNNEEDKSGRFEDNFSDKLADSQEYLKRLEAKLERLQRGNGNKSLLKDLEAKRKDEMRRFLDDETRRAQQDEEVESAIANNELLRRLAPETRAVNKQELIHLIKDDD